MLGGGGWWPPFFLPLTCGADSFFWGGLGAFRWGRFIFPYTPWLGGADRDGGRGGGFAGAARGDKARGAGDGGGLGQGAGTAGGFRRMGAGGWGIRLAAWGLGGIRLQAPLRGD